MVPIVRETLKTSSAAALPKLLPLTCGLRPTAPGTTNSDWPVLLSSASPTPAPAPADKVAVSVLPTALPSTMPAPHLGTVPETAVRWP
jgi:hypothetical protein